MIKITDEMREASKKRIEKICKNVDEQITRAVQEGKNSCHFACDMDADADVYQEVVRLYEKEGYRIYPAGLIGGVLQRSERIAW